MNSPILPVGGPSGPSVAGSVATTAGDLDDLFTVGPDVAGEMPAIAVARIGPPVEVLEQMAAATATDKRLRASGQHVRFLAGAPGERTRVEIHDCHGNTVRPLSLSEAFDLAMGLRAV